MKIFAVAVATIALTASLQAQDRTRDALKAMAANYFKAVEAHSMSALPTTASVRITEMRLR